MLIHYAVTKQDKADALAPVCVLPKRYLDEGDALAAAYWMRETEPANVYTVIPLPIPPSERVRVGGAS